MIYLFGYIASIADSIIGYGILKGYELAKEPQNKFLIFILVFVTLIVVLLCNMVIIPLIQLNNNGYEVSLYNLRLLYNNDKFLTATINDMIMSIIFAGLGIYGIIKTTYKNITKNS